MWQTVGHDRVVDSLKRSLREGRASHAYLLAGPSQVGKMTLALDLARALNCTGDEAPCGECGQCTRISRGLHADITIVDRRAGDSGDGRPRVLIGIDQVRELQRQAGLKPYEGRCRVFVFDGAALLSEEASNSLLKTLEEPPDQVALLLLTTDAAGLLPTIISRCHVLELRRLPVDLVSSELQSRLQVGAADADEVARLSEGRLGWALEAAAGPETLQGLEEALDAVQDAVRGGVEARFAYAAGLASTFSGNREAGRHDLALWLAWWRDVMMVKHGTAGLVTHRSAIASFESVAGALSSSQVVAAIQAVRQGIDHLERNVNPRLALEYMMLAMPRP